MDKPQKLQKPRRSGNAYCTTKDIEQKREQAMECDVIGHRVVVTVDRPLGTRHPEHDDIIYSVNYGFVKGVPGGDGEWQDVYILGIDHPVGCFRGCVIAVIRRADDVEDKWVVAPDGVNFSDDEIMKAVAFQERYFESEVIR